MSGHIRVAMPADASVLVQIEKDAGQLFRAAEGLEWLADGEGLSLETYLQLIHLGTVWVMDEASALTGFLAAQIEDAELHIVEVSVRRQHQRRGFARALIQYAAVEARILGLAAITLTTFRDLAWNEQWYARLGFQTLEEAAIGERLRSLLELEAAAGLPRERRCAMRLTL